MFEKEAEEYCRQDDLGHFIRTTEEVKQAYKEGAKFGYQKAKEEMKKSALNSLAEAIETWR